jgi:hypothetical protein
VIGNKPAYKVCEDHIIALTEIADGDFYKFPVTVFSKLKRALYYAISLNDFELIAKVKNTIINFENRHSLDDEPNLLGHSYRMIIFSKIVAAVSSQYFINFELLEIL